MFAPSLVDINQAVDFIHSKWDTDYAQSDPFEFNSSLWIDHPDLLIKLLAICDVTSFFFSATFLLFNITLLHLLIRECIFWESNIYSLQSWKGPKYNNCLVLSGKFSYLSFSKNNNMKSKFELRTPGHN